jgi:hypothetical protein
MSSASQAAREAAKAQQAQIERQRAAINRPMTTEQQQREAHGDVGPASKPVPPSKP